MNQNNSPWLAQLKVVRNIDIIGSDQKSDVVIVGAGISGVMTAYFTLKFTDKSVILLEGNRVAHGATGHNAGQIVADFEKEFTNLVAEYGLEKAAEAERSVRGAWVLLEALYEEASLSTPLSSFMGYNGYKEVDHIVKELKANALRREAGLQTYPLYISESVVENDSLKEFSDLYEVVPHENILSLLETSDANYIAAVALKKGCTNSAVLSEEIIGYLLSTYKGRFSLFEHSSVKNIILNKDNVVMEVATNKKNGTAEESYSVETGRLVLCTNGFERMHIKNNAGDDVDVKFHQMVNGDVGYMAAYVEELKEPPTALGYYDQDVDEESKTSLDPYTEKPYFYVTRRPYENENNQTHNLICIGGPEKLVAETQDYDRQAPFSPEMGEKIDEFVAKTIKGKEKEGLEYKFQWHGIMCYTPSRMRVIGPEPKNPLLMYSLGCNGVGILSSIHGGWKIGKMIAGETFPESVFDPKN